MLREIGNLDELVGSKQLAVIVNCGTKWFTSLAVASFLRHSAAPVLIIDCESTDGSLEHFAHCFSKAPGTVYCLRLPLKAHGDTLDSVFGNLEARQVFLVDSDLEITNGRIIGAMQQALDSNPAAYGAGLLQQGGWMVPPYHNFPPDTAWYHERMWVPLVLLRVGRVRGALTAGESFAAVREHCEAGEGRLSRLLGIRFRLPIFKRMRFTQTAAPRNPVVADSPQPLIKEYDTGSRMHLGLQARGYEFSAISDEYWHAFRHVNGVTRAANANWLFRAAVRLRVIPSNQLADVARMEELVKSRLRANYPEFLPKRHPDRASSSSKR